MKMILIVALLVLSQKQQAMQIDDTQQKEKSDLLNKIALIDSFMYPKTYFSITDDKICYVRMSAKIMRHYILSRSAVIEQINQMKVLGYNGPYKNIFDITQEFKELQRKNPRLSIACLLQTIPEEQKLNIQAFRFMEFLLECNDANLAKYKELKDKATPRLQQELRDKYTAFSNRRNFLEAWQLQDEKKIRATAQLEMYPTSDPFLPLTVYIAKLMRFAMEENKAIDYPTRAFTQQ